ncbi:phytoene desaturase family protein [Planctomycetota bacterium]
MHKKIAPYYDVIVVGSGIGGLTAALLHAKFGRQKVLLLEQHFKPGGYLQSFSRGKYTWDVGLHYLGAMAAGTFPRKIMDLLTRGQVTWRALPDPFEVFHYPAFTISQPPELVRYLERLRQTFPEELGLDAYIRDLRLAMRWGTWQFAAKVLPRFLAWFPRLIARLFYGRYRERKLVDSLNEHFHSESIKAVLASQCGDYGLSPSQASLFVHASIFFHYEAGGYRPEGGASELVQAITRHLRHLGVDLFLGQRVDEILIENASVRGVRCTPVHGEETRGPSTVVQAGRIVSAVGVRNTYLQMVDRTWIPPQLRKILQDFPPGSSMIVTYLGLKEDPAALGFDGANHWFYQTSNLSELGSKLANPEALGVPAVFVSFDRSKNVRGETIHTATLVAPACYQAFRNCGDPGRWQHRSAAYEQLKTEQGQRLLDLVDGRVPGFRALVDTLEISTPLSFEYFSRHPRGEVYGLPGLGMRYTCHALGPRTPIKGLTLAGADSLAHGVVGAMMGGLAAYSSSLGPWQVIRFFRMLSRLRIPDPGDGSQTQGGIPASEAPSLRPARPYPHGS